MTVVAGKTLRCHFTLRSVFMVGLTRFLCLAFGDNYVKKKIFSCCQRRKCSPGTLFSGDIRLMGIFAKVLQLASNDILPVGLFNALSHQTSQPLSIRRIKCILTRCIDSMLNISVVV